MCDELLVPSLDTRQVNLEDVKRKLSNIADHVQKINAAPRQPKIEPKIDKYTEPRAILH